MTFAHKYPPTKLMWIPDLVFIFLFLFFIKINPTIFKFLNIIQKGTYKDILATSGESLKI